MKIAVLKIKTIQKAEKQKQYISENGKKKFLKKFKKKNGGKKQQNSGIRRNKVISNFFLLFSIYFRAT